MAGFFGLFDYNKDGPGVPKDAPPKHPLLVLLDIYLRKFWSLIRINLLFSLFNLPASLLAIYILSIFFLPGVVGEDLLVDFFARFVFGVLVVSIPIVTVGPAQAGFTYILRNYAREEHAFIWSDFKDAAKKNFKQSSIISIISLLVTVIIGVDLNIYLDFMSQGSTWFAGIANGVVIVAFITMMFIHMYIYPMMVTFKLSLKQLYKNAFIFAFIRFLPNIGILLADIFVILITALAFALSASVGIIVYCTLTLSTIGLINNFFVYPSLKKYILIEGNDEPEQKTEKPE